MVALIWIAGLGAAMQFAKLSIAFDSLVAHYKAAPGTMGAILSAVGIMSLLFGATAGILTGRLGYRRVILMALGLGAVLSAGQALLLPLPFLFISRLIEGLSHLSLVVALPSLMIAITAPKYRAVTMGLWGTFFSAGFAILSFFGAPLFQKYGPSALLLGHACVMAALAFCFHRWTKPEMDHAKPAHQMGPFPILTENIKIYLHLKTALPGFLFFFQGAMFVSILTFVPSFAPDPETITLLRTTLPLISIAGTFLAGMIAQYLLSPLRLTISSFLILILAAFWLIGAGNADAGFIIPSFFLLLMSGMVQGSVFALVPYLTDEPLFQSRANGAIAQLANLGGTLFIPVFASLMDIYGPKGFLLLVSGLAASAIAVAFTGLKKLNLR